MLQKDKKFIPHILPVCVGTMCRFPNLDPIFHNAFSNFNGQFSTLGSIRPGSTLRPVRQAAGLCGCFAIFTLRCRPLSSCWILRISRTTDEEGLYSLSRKSRAGEYQVHLFHERTTPKIWPGLPGKCRSGTRLWKLPPIVDFRDGLFAGSAQKQIWPRVFDSQRRRSAGLRSRTE